MAANDLTKELVVAEIKLNGDKINLAELQQKAQNLCLEFQGYTISYKALGLEDAAEYLTTKM